MGHICQTEAAALDQALESLKAECSSSTTLFMLQQFDPEGEFSADAIGVTSFGDRVRMNFSPKPKEYEADDVFWYPVEKAEVESEAAMFQFAKERNYTKDDVYEGVSTFCNQPFVWEYYYGWDANEKDLCSCP